MKIVPRGHVRYFQMVAIDKVDLVDRFMSLVVRDDGGSEVDLPTTKTILHKTRTISSLYFNIFPL